MNRNRFLQLILFALAALLTVALFMGVKDSRQVRLSTRSATGTAPVSQSAVVQAASATTVMVKPRYTGEDDAGRHWEVTADNASQSGTMASSTMTLGNVAANWQDSATTVNLSARQGQYMAETKTLSLMGDVSASGPTFQLNAPAVEADLATRNLSGNEGVTLSGTLGNTPGTITADNFKVDAQSRKVVLTGNVKVVLERKP